MKRKYWLLLLVIAVVLNGSPVLADSEFYVIAGGGGVGTKITRLPYTINASGFYYLGGDLTCASGPGIIINIDNVTVDLMGFTLTGTMSPSKTENYGIDMRSGPKNVEIRNGSLIGWDMAIYATISSANNRVVNVRAENNFIGIVLLGVGHLVTGCTLSDNTYWGVNVTGGSTISNNVLNNNTANGIMINNGIGTISGNVVSNSNFAIYLNGGGSIIGNMVRCNSGQTGIKLSGTTVNGPVMLDQNTVTGTGTPFDPGSVPYTPGTNAGF
jgi:parallel beta-helix repeat protein